MESTTMIQAETDKRLMTAMTYLHAAYETYCDWMEAGDTSRFRDENFDCISDISSGFGKLENKLADLIGVKLTYDLEAKYRH